VRRNVKFVELGALYHFSVLQLDVVALLCSVAKRTTKHLNYAQAALATLRMTVSFFSAALLYSQVSLFRDHNSESYGYYTIVTSTLQFAVGIS
jgi:hypothetical protein